MIAHPECQENLLKYAHISFAIITSKNILEISVAIFSETSPLKATIPPNALFFDAKLVFCCSC